MRQACTGNKRSFLKNGGERTDQINGFAVLESIEICIGQMAELKGEGVGVENVKTWRAHKKQLFTPV